MLARLIVALLASSDVLLIWMLLGRRNSGQ